MKIPSFTAMSLGITLLAPIVLFANNTKAMDLKTGNPASAGHVIDVETFAQSGLYTADLVEVKPEQGLLASFDLSFPNFTHGRINQGNLPNFVSGYLTSARIFASFDEFNDRNEDALEDERFRHAFEMGYFMLLKLQDGRYLAVLPVATSETMTYISLYNGTPKLKLSNFGTDAFGGEAPLFSWAYADDPYTATRQCWERVLESDFFKDNLQFRWDKDYPEAFEYLGWCTWEAFEGSINEKKVIDSIEELKAATVPIRWMIVDDGYLDNTTGEGPFAQIRSFGVNEKFPHGWDTITSLKEDSNLKWMGIWRNMSGGMAGVALDHTMTNLNDHLFQKEIYRHNRDRVDEQIALLIKPDYASSNAFYQEMVRDSVENNFDFLKVDFQTLNFWMYHMSGNPVNSVHQNNQALERIAYTHNLGLLNCIAQSNVNVFNTKYSVLSRASVDIKLTADNRPRTVQSFDNNLWWGEVLVADLDMYHTSNEKNAQYLTVARAISGGPVYLSDEPAHFVDDVIRPLIFNNGQVIRAIAPAVPLPGSLFERSVDGSLCYRVIAPTRDGSCSVAVFNFTGQADQSSYLSQDDYPYAAAKLEEQEGLWAEPSEGLVAFDYQTQTAFLLEADYNFTVPNGEGKIFGLAPIQENWAVIGRSDKMLGGGTYQIGRRNADTLQLTLDESGPIIIYNDRFTPHASEGTLVSLGAGFYSLDLPVGEMSKRIILSNPGN